MSLPLLLGVSVFPSFSGRWVIASGLSYSSLGKEGGTMGGEVAITIQAIITAITNMAQTVADNALSVIANVLPVLGTVVAAVIVARLGYRLVKRFSA